MKLRGVAAALIALGVVGTSANSQPSFAPARNYLVGEDPLSIAIGDLNGDRKADLAAASATSEVVSVLVNRGDGRFHARREYATDESPQSVAIGDLNGDGKRDLVTANNVGNDVSVLLNKGDGTFRPRRDYSTHADDGAKGVAIGALNGDGKPDLVTANTDSISVLFNEGDGSFRRMVDYITGADAVAIGDLNGDGKSDLAFGSSRFVSIFLNAGDGSFSARIDRVAERRVMSIAIADLNGDRRADLATVNSQASCGGPDGVSVLLDNGGGSFLLHDYAGCVPQSLAVDDLSGDGKPDLATTHGSDNVSVLVNRGDGSFQPPRGYAAGDGPTSVAIGDLNRDRRQDLAVSTAQEVPGSVYVLLNATGACGVPQITHRPLPVARRRIASTGCSVGKIRRSYSTRVKKGRVISQTPTAGTVLRRGGKVNLVVSRGRRQ